MNSVHKYFVTLMFRNLLIIGNRRDIGKDLGVLARLCPLNTAYIIPNHGNSRIVVNDQKAGAHIYTPANIYGIRWVTANSDWFV